MGRVGRGESVSALGRWAWLALWIPSGAAALDAGAGVGSDGDAHRVEGALRIRSAFAAVAETAAGRRGHAGVLSRHAGVLAGRFRLASLAGGSTGRPGTPDGRMAWRNGIAIRPSTSLEALSGVAVRVDGGGLTLVAANGRAGDDPSSVRVWLAGVRVRSIAVEVGVTRGGAFDREDLSVHLGGRSTGAGVHVTSDGGVRILCRQRAGAHRLDTVWETHRRDAGWHPLGSPGEGWALRYRHRRLYVDHARRGLDGRTTSRVAVPVSGGAVRGRVELRHVADGTSVPTLRITLADRRARRWPLHGRADLRPEADGHLATSIQVSTGGTLAGVGVETRVSWASAPGFFSAARQGLTGFRAFRLPQGALVTQLRATWRTLGASWVSPIRTDGEGALVSIWFRLRD